MPRLRKINLEKLQASLDKTCPRCEFVITPDLVKPCLPKPSGRNLGSSVNRSSRWGLRERRNRGQEQRS
jgi:hypothetical protein